MIKVNGKEVEFEEFPNGETKLIHESIVIEDYSYVDFKYENDSDLIKLLFVSEYIYMKTLGANLRIQYMPYSRMDRSENNSPFTLQYIAHFINSMNFDEVEIIEPHSNITLDLITNSKGNYINFDLVKRVKEEVGFDEEKDYIVFPDEGASERYGEMKATNILYCDKVRDFETGEIKGLELVGDTSKVYGRNAIIVDDLSSYGGTFIHTANRLREEGFIEVYLLVAHAENSIFTRNDRTGQLLFEHVDKIFTTDTILTEQNAWHNVIYAPKLKVYEIEGVLKND